MSLTIKINELCAAMLIIFCGMYINVSPVPPVYISFFLGFCLLLIDLFGQSIRVVPVSIFTALVYFVYLYISQIDIEKDSAFYNYLFSVAYYVVVCFALSSITRDSLLKYSIRFIDVSLILLVVEAVWRFSHPVFRQGNIGRIAFYKFKYNSIMYQDSNYVGIFAVILLFFIVFLEKKGSKLTWRKIMCFAMILLTISRSAIITTVVFSFLYSTRVKKTWKSFLLIIILIAGIWLGFNYISVDSSFQSKLKIIDRAVNFYLDTSIGNKLFGIGLGETVKYIGIGSHNFFVTIILETGLIGFVLFCAFWGQILIESHNACSFIMFPFLGAGLSMAQHFIPFLYVTYAIITMYENLNNRKDYFQRLDLV